jgi:outer membrane protein TolC
MKKIISFLIVYAFTTPCLAVVELDLPSAVHFALSNNEQVIMSENRVKAARAKVSQSFSGYLPSLSLSANYSRNYASPIISEFKVGDIDTPVTFGFNEPYDSKSWQATLTQNIFTFGKLEGRLAMALESVRAAEEEYRKARQDVIYGAALAYFDVIRSESALMYAKRAHESAKDHFARVEVMRNRGRVSEAELLRAEVALLSAEQVLIKAQNSERLALINFNSTVGIPASGTYTLSERDLSGFMKVETRPYDGITKEAYEFNPDLKLAKSAVKMSENALVSAKANWLPSVAAKGTYGWNNTDYSVSAIDFDQTNWSVAAGASWALFDGFDTQSRIKEAAASLDEARAALSLAAKAAELGLRQAYYNHISAAKVREVAAKAIKSARAGSEASSIRYRHGLASNIEVLDAQSSLAKAELELLSADFDLCMSYLSLKKASGTLDREVFSSAREGFVR